jgi:D-beta-D-heptose 7-phosphate kinase/D-beta-D-heptose 1-phosphate adenosyltransferase
MKKITLPNYSNAKVLVVGDVMLDKYWKGGSNRISPEAPVPVVKVGEIESRPGGAANVALNISSLGGSCTLVGLVGSDDSAKELAEHLERNNLNNRSVVVPDMATITKIRILSRGQQLLRMDFEDGFENVDQAPILARLRECVKDCNVVIFSDYGKGALHSVQTMIQIARDAGCKVLIDPKGTDFSKYSGATLLTPNMSEFEAVVGKVTSEEDLIAKGKKLIQDYNIEELLVTRSENGMTLIRLDAEPLTLPTEAKEVYDVTGAGDTVIGTLAISLSAGASIEESCALANKAAGIVVGKVGTSTVSPRELQKVIASDYEAKITGVVTKEELVELIKTAQSKGQKIVMTNGCFDILHAGHVAYLEQAKSLGDMLIVAVNSDESVQRLKGPTRPIVNLEQRMAVLSSLASVDWVVSFDDDTPRALIAEVLPDILVKGGDYQPEEIAGYAEVVANGGEVRILCFKDDCSTSGIVKKIISTSEEEGKFERQNCK